jgi:hypothetical protein
MTFKLGAWKAQCQRCGFDYLNHDLRKEWTGLRVCRDCFEIRHPQDFVRGVRDDQAPPWTSPPSNVSKMAYPILDESGVAISDENGDAILDGGVTAEL